MMAPTKFWCFLSFNCEIWSIFRGEFASNAPVQKNTSQNYYVWPLTKWAPFNDPLKKPSAKCDSYNVPRKKTLTFCYTVSYNQHIAGKYNLPYTLNNPFFFHCSNVSCQIFVHLFLTPRHVVNSAAAGEMLVWRRLTGQSTQDSLKR